MRFNILSFDIEVLPRGEQMPIPEECPVVMISCAGNYNLLGVEGGDEKRKIVMILNREHLDGGLDKEIVYKKEILDNGGILLRFNNEEEMIKKWVDITKKADIIVGYNINGFDIPYIVDRSRVLGLGNYVNIGMADDSLWHKGRVSKGMKVVTIGGAKGKLIFDVLYMLRRSDESNVMKKEYNLKNLTLAHVSREILGEDSAKLKFSAKDMVIWWETGIREKEFIEYGLRDAEVVLEIVQKFRLLDRFFMLSRKSGKLIQDVVDSQGFGGLVENLLIRAYGAEDRVMPCRRGVDKDDDGKDDLEGAYVLEPKLGITDYIGSCDYKSLYPTLMIKYNLCFSTLINSITMDKGNYEILESEDGVEYGRFVRSSIKKGIIPILLEDLMVERSKLKGEMKKYEKGTAEYIMYDAGQNAAKILLNSFYGYCGDKNSRIYSWNVSSAVTGSGRKQIKSTINNINKSTAMWKDKKYDMKVALADTDSSYLQVVGNDKNETLNRDIVVGCANDIIEKINMELEKPMELSFENYIRRLLVTAKKHYVMLIEDDKGRKSLISKGIESVRRDWCDYSSDTMDNVIEAIMYEDDIKVGIKKSIELVKEETEKLRRGITNIEKLVLSKKLTMPLTSYDSKAVHVAVAKKMMKRGKKVEIGDRISFFILDNGKKLVSERAEDVEYVMSHRDECKISNEYYIAYQLIPPIERVLNVLGVSGSVLRFDRRQKSLMDY